EQKSAEITLDQEISNQLLTQTITDAGYEVVEIR
ncbi:MAG: heavy metal transport/detoxification protein, partial [Lachnospiraceae bacterium]|nr:heavy metal transport/detoxification protein [Lachnospiraceae bacterium]